MKCGCICCGSKPQEEANFRKTIPPAVLKYQSSVRTPQDWKNPYLVVTAGDVQILGGPSVPLEGLEAYLISLPKSAWPYGRLVAVQDMGIRSGKDDDKINKNLVAIMRVLKELDIHANPWPSA